MIWYTELKVHVFANRAHKKLSAIGSWENTKKATVEAELKKIEVTIHAFLPKTLTLCLNSDTKSSGVLHSVCFQFWHFHFVHEQEQLEKKKAEYVEQMKNKIALIHKAAEEKRAAIEAKRGEDLLKAEETAAKYRATGYAPKKLLGCLSGWT